jgi:DNA polymerase-3 subunit epsilon
MNLTKLKRWFYRKLYKESFDAFNWEIDFDKPVKEHCFVVFDTETTGIYLKRAKVLSIGAFRLQGLTLKFSDSINLKLNIFTDNLESIEVHGITPEDLKDGVSPKEACERFLEFSRGCLLVGYFVDIDIAVMRNLIKDACSGAFYPYHLDVIDLLEKDQIPTLEELTKRLNLPTSTLHDALEDAYMTSLIFIK